MHGEKFSMPQDGVYLAQRVVPSALIDTIHDELLVVARHLGVPNTYAQDIDSAWNWLCKSDRAIAGLLYNAFKRLPSVFKLASSSEILHALVSQANVDSPMLVDINCRIDSNAGDKFLFDWHQDYWFSICSPNAVVVWIPLTDVTPEIGGLDVISNKWTGGRIFSSKAGEKYDSYADAVKLDEEIPHSHAVPMLPLATDALLFRFSVLHRSRRVVAEDRSRFTVQLRFADAADRAFRQNQFKPGVVGQQKTDYLSIDKSKPAAERKEI